MNGILQWSLAQSAEHPSNAPPVPLTAERKEFLSNAFAAASRPSDAQLMKEALSKAVDEKLGEDERLQALEDFEELTTNIDNANDIENMKMWPAIQGFLAEKSEEMVTAALFIIGTAAQNNPSAQSSYLSLQPAPMTSILSILSSTRSPHTRAKAVYALSGLLKHNASGLATLDDAAWDTINQTIKDPAPPIRRKITFLLNALLIPGTTETTSLPPPSKSHPNTSVAFHTSTQPSAPEPIYANSHSSLLSNPSQISTSAVLLPKIGPLIKSVVHGLARDEDEQVKGHCLRLIYTYVVVCASSLDAADLSEVRRLIEQPDNEIFLELEDEERKQLVEKLK